MVFIPNQDPVTGKAHLRTKFDRWQVDTAEYFGPVVLVGERVPRLWFEGRTAVGDDCHWFRVTVDSGRLSSWHTYLQQTAYSFGVPSLGISRAAVYKAISKGALETVQIGAMTLVVLASAKAYRKARAKHAA